MDKKTFFGGESDIFLFREGSLMVISAVVSLLLQIISFFTTLDGAKAYFSATFAYAPLLFALAVQSVVYFLENGLRRRPTFLKAAALTLAICCSSYFSFVGIYNNINPTEQYLDRTYSSYTRELQTLYSERASDRVQAFTLAADDSVNFIISEYTLLTSEKEKLDRLSDEIDSAKAEAVNGMTAPRRYEYKTYEEYAAAYSAYIAGFSQSSTEEQQAKLQAVLNKYGITDASDVAVKTADAAARLSLIEGTMATYGGESFYQSAERLRSAVMRGDENALSKLSALYLSISGKAADIPVYVSSDSTELELPAYREIAGSSPASVVRQKLTAVISSACDRLSMIGVDLNAEDYSFENIYTLPIYAVLSGSFGADALVSLLLAVLVDVLSLLFAMIFVRGKSILSVSATDQAIAADERLFERNIVTAVRLSMVGEGRRYSTCPDIDEVADRLAEFVNRFRAVDIVTDKGFTLAADRDKVSDCEPLTAFLCQFGLAKLLTKEEMSLLSGVEEGSDTILLKTKFLLWVSERSGFTIKDERKTDKETAVKV